MTITTFADTVAETNETIRIIGQASGYGTFTADLAITDADSTVVLTPSATVLSEGGDGSGVSVSAAFKSPGGTAATSSVIGTASDVTLTVAGGTVVAADFSYPTAGTVTIPASAVASTSPVSLSGLSITDDDVVEGPETLVLSGSHASLSVASSTLTISDDDADVVLSVSPEAVPESASAHQVTVTASFAGSSSVLASSTDVTVTVAGGGGADGAALGSSGDFTTDATGDQLTITIPAGYVSAAGSFNLAARADGTSEGLEKVALSGSAAVGGSAVTVTGAGIGIVDGPGSVSVLDQSSPPVAVSSLGEGAGTSALSVRVGLPSGVTAPAGGLTARFRVVGGTAVVDDGSSFDAGEDFRVTYGAGSDLSEAYPGSVSIAAGASSGTASFSLVINDDEVFEVPSPETVLVQATVAVGGLALPLTQASLGIDDNDQSLELALLDSDDDPLDAVTEGSSVAVKVKAAWALAYTHASAVTVQVTVGAAGDTAVSGTDYAPVAAFDVTIAAGDNSSTGGFTLDVSGDDYDDGSYTGDRRLSVVGVESAGSFPVASARLTITDDESPPGPPPVSTGPSTLAPPTANPDPVGGLARPEGCERGRFCDDEASVHQAGIDAIAGLGITRGCDPDDPWLFCPRRGLSRGQIAALLYRAVTYWAVDAPEPDPRVELADVPAGAWYETYARWAVSAGALAAPGGEFGSAAPVTRADMAVAMVAAFSHLAPARPRPPEGLFADMEGQDPAVVRAVEALFRAGVTRGCATGPLRYCPDRPVTRAQMASFIARTLTTDH